MTLEEQVGQKLVFGIPGTVATPEILQHLKDTHCGGLMLYRINFESPDQLRKLITDLEAGLGRRLLVCTDHEGGRVVMFRDGVTVFPSNQALGATGNTQYARHQGEQEGRELRRLGIDVNFAPVLDVLTDAYSPNIGIRAYGKDPELVAKMGAARISAMQVEGVSACAKHFPGLGPATLDPHLKLPSIAVTWEDLERVHLVPFYRAMRTAVHSMMTSHPLYPQLDSTPNTPATFSRKIVHDFLRQKTGYKGVIFSDDLEMGAIGEICPIGEAAVRAIAAGHDIVLACHDLKLQRDVYEALLKAYQSGSLSMDELNESAKRIEMLRGRRQDRFAPQPATAARAEKERQDLQTVLTEISSKSVQVLRAGAGLQPNGKTVVVFPDLAALSQKIMIERDIENGPSFVEVRLRELNVPAEVKTYTLDVDGSQQSAILDAVRDAEQTLIFLYDAHIHPSQKELLDQVRANAKRLVVALMRDAYDVEFVPEGVLCVTNFGPRAADVAAVLGKTVGASSPSAV